MKSVTERLQRVLGRRRTAAQLVQPLREGEWVYRRTFQGLTQSGQVHKSTPGLVYVQPLGTKGIQVWDDRETQRMDRDVVDTYL